MYVCKMVYTRYIEVIGAVLICTGLCTVTQSVIYTTVGSTVNLTCNLPVERMYVSWLGPPNFSSYAVGNEVEDVYKYSIRIDGNAHEKKHILQIVNMQEKNEGYYKCTAIKGQEYFQLLIQEPPKNITIMESNDNNVVFGVVNREINLTCYVEPGKPPETMHWEYEHKVVANGRAGPLIYTFTPSSKHHLKNFTCTAHNNVSRTTLKKKVSLYLFSEPTVKIYPSGTINLTEDQTLVLECIDTSNDNNDNINWKYTKNGDVHIIANNKLKLDNINITNEGNYSCLASNLAGKAEDMVTVKIFYRTAKPKNIQSVALTNKIIVMWQAGYDGGLRQSFFIEYRKNVDVTWLIISAGEQSIFVINGLQSDTVYIVRMYSKTDYDESDRTGEIIAKTGKQGIEGTHKLAFIPGIISLLLILSWFGIKAFKNRCNFNGNAKRVTPRESETTYVRHIAQYDEIDSLYYNPMNDTIVRQAASQNQSSEAIQQETPRNVDIIRSRIIFYPSTTHEIAVDRNSQHTLFQCNLSERSSSEESYLVPCRRYTDQDSFFKNEHRDNQTDQLNIEIDDLSVASESSETNAKSVKKYETLLPVNTGEHSYQ